jgi:hypothetical protein
MLRFTQEQLRVPARAVAKASGLDPSLITIEEDATGTIHGHLKSQLVASGSLETVIVAVSLAANEYKRMTR